MTTKDYVYLGLLALGSLVFYCHGFYAGISRSARIYDALLKDEETPDDTLDSLIVEAGNEQTAPAPTSRLSSLPTSTLLPPTRRELRSDFGNN